MVCRRYNCVGTYLLNQYSWRKTGTLISVRVFLIPSPIKNCMTFWRIIRTFNASRKQRIFPFCKPASRPAIHSKSHTISLKTPALESQIRTRNFSHPPFLRNTICIAILEMHFPCRRGLNQPMCTQAIYSTSSSTRPTSPPAVHG